MKAKEKIKEATELSVTEMGFFAQEKKGRVLCGKDFHRISFKCFEIRLMELTF